MKRLWIELNDRIRELEEWAGTETQNTPIESLSMYQLHILSALYTEDHQHASSLARAVGRAATSFTPVLDKLERAGYIQRIADTADRRAVYIELTPKGASIQNEVCALLERIEREFKRK